MMWESLCQTQVSLKHLEVICQDLLMDGGENSEIWDQSHCVGFPEQQHRKLEPF